MSLVVHQICKKYGDQVAVSPISFSIQKGEIVGFLGPNGAGKSTTLKMIAGFIAPDSGSIVLNGIPMHLDSMMAKRLIGYLPESNPLYEDLYVKEYLQFLCEVHQIKGRSKRINEVVELLGLQSMQYKKIEQLSKGFKQRLGIAAAIMHKPALLLLDEPTSGLDPNQLIEIRSIIKSLSNDCMILFSSHILQEVTAICTSILVLHKGELVANKSIDAILQPDAHSLRVTFEEDITEFVEPFCALHPSIQVVDKHVLVAKMDMNKDIKKLIMQFALDKGLNIQRLQTEEASLEEIFKLLTH